MRLGLAAALLAVVLGTTGASTGARAQGSGIPCDAFVKNADNSWSATRSLSVPGAGRYFSVNQGAVFRPGNVILGVDLAETLDQQCPAVAASAPIPGAPPQTELTKLAEPNGDIDIQKITCGQLANTFQEDADLIGAWYVGWSNGAAKKPVLNVLKVRDSIHDVIVYCKANRDRRVMRAFDAVLKNTRR